MEINHALSERAIGHYGCIGRAAISHQRERDESRHAASCEEPRKLKESRAKLKLGGTLVARYARENAGTGTAAVAAN